MSIVPIARSTPNAPATGRPRVRYRIEVSAPNEPDQTDRPVDAIEASSSPTPATPYEVGFKRPPAHTRFKKGQSGNPRGRPKGAKGIKTIVRSIMVEKVLVRMPAGEKKITRIEAVIQKTLELAMKGNARALAQLISLYSAAVPDIDPQLPAQTTPIVEELSATDLATLDELRALLASTGDLS